jgi:cyanophycinase
VLLGKRIREAEALFIAGGDQANYVNFWSNTPVSEAISYLIHTKKIPIGGTSAGCAVLSDFVFDAKRGTAVSSDVLSNPYHISVSLSKSFIQAPFLQNVIADQHYSQRSREGRHVTFLARMAKDFSLKKPRGLGVDERTAVCIDELGNAVVFGSGSAYFLQALSTSESCEADKPLVWKRKQNAVGVAKIDASLTGSPAFNLKHWPKKFSSYWWIENGVLMRR